MPNTLCQKFAPIADEIFKAESKRELVSNSNFDWTGAHSVVLLKITAADMNDYGRNVFSDADSIPVSRFGDLVDLDREAEELILSKDRSFIFNIDKLDIDETGGQLEAGAALARQIREKVIPEIDTYVFGKMVTGAGTTADAAEISEDNIYDLILAGSETLDDAEVPETDRVLVLPPASYTALKKSTAFDNTPVNDELKVMGVVAYLDGMKVIRVPATRLPANIGFIICHPEATTAPVKLEDYNAHPDTVLSSGTIITGRVCYDAFVLENKADAIYVQPASGAQGATGSTGE